MFLQATTPLLFLAVLLTLVSSGQAKNKHKYAAADDDAPSLAPPPALSAAAAANNRTAASTSVYYDQRQTGKYNINVNIKDVAIISIDPQQLAGNVGDSSADGDYYEDYYDYDMDDYTVSPIAALLGGLTTKKPKTTTTSSSSVEDIQIGSTSASSETLSAENASLSTVAESLTTAGANNATQTISTKSTAVTAASSTEQQQPIMPQLQENEIPVHIVMEAVRGQQSGGSSSGGRRRSQQQQKRRRQSSVRRQSQPLRCARGQERDENGRCPAVAAAASATTHGRRRVGMQKVMDLLTMLTPHEKE